MIKQIFIMAAMLALFSSCSTPSKTPVMDPVRNVASYGSNEGTYITKEIRNDDGQIGVLREFELVRNYSGRNLKGLIIEVLPFNGYANRTRVDVTLNGRTVETHDIQVRAGRQHLYTDIDMEIRDEVRQLQLRYNPREVSVRSVTVLVNEDRPWENRPGNDSFTQLLERIARNRGGRSYDVFIPPSIEARYLVLEAVNAPVVVYNVMAGNQSIQLPGAYGARLMPGMPVEVMLPGYGRIDNLRITAEGMQTDMVGLKVSVSPRSMNDGPNYPGPVQPWPDRPNPPPAPPTPLPPRIVTEECTVTRYDPAGMLILNYTGTATGAFNTNLREQACQQAMMNCRRELRGRQTCR
ncbi:MAG: hypothetical protein WC635_11530 [Bacteriovorax sp.]|jgi:hypothetical protein